MLVFIYTISLLSLYEEIVVVHHPYTNISHYTCVDVIRQVAAVVLLCMVNAVLSRSTILLGLKLCGRL